MKTFEVDQGESFGTWGDEVSRLMYETSLRRILHRYRLRGHVGDFGGANGLLQHYGHDCMPAVTKVTTVDVDASKGPDIVADICTHDAPYDVVFMRYVAHYLTDQQLIGLLDNFNAPRMLMVQFVNDKYDLVAKYANSFNEVKYFRTREQLMALCTAGGKCEVVHEERYVVTPEFYTNRLGAGNYAAHGEGLLAIEIRR